jgi:hypothetical protein
MLKKMLVVAAILAMAGTVFGAQWNFNFSTQVPSKTIPDPCNPGKTLPNPDYAAFDKANYGTDRTVDWEVWSDNNNLAQRKSEIWNWPATYDWVQMGIITVKMDVGFWIKLDCRDTNVLVLKQRQINQYGGQTTCKAYTNVATEWKADWSKKSGVDLGGSFDKTVSLSPTTFNATGNTAQILTIKMKAWNVELYSLTPQKDCVEIGTIKLSVRPSIKPNIFMSGCSDMSYPVYSPPPATADVVWW